MSRINTTHKPLDHWHNSPKWQNRTEQPINPVIINGNVTRPRFDLITWYTAETWWSFNPEQPINRPLPPVPTPLSFAVHIRVTKQRRAINRKAAAKLLREAAALLDGDAPAQYRVESWIDTEDYRALTLTALADDLEALEYWSNKS